MGKKWSKLVSGIRRSADRACAVVNDKEFWLRWVQGIAVMAVLFQPISWMFFQRARPEVTTFIDRKLDKSPRNYWDTGMASVGELFLIMSLCTSVLGLLIYWTIYKQQKTRAGWVLGTVAVVSVISLIYYYTKF